MSKQERAVRTRRDLVHAAAVAFEQYGYVQATLATISDHAGVSTGALHFHFENKAALAAAVEAAANEQLRAVVREACGSTGPALQALAEASQEVSRLLRANVVFRAGFQLNFDVTRRSDLDLRREWHACVQNLIDKARDGGGLMRSVVPHDVVAVIVAATVGFGLLGRESQEWLSPNTLAGFWELLLPRLAAVPE
ncbi:ScbR family autoregulator-binding transcription factor [Streptomyces sp. NPDC002133]|uniref:ScbR family autoregulator-binding transcription factor n=1 Tax=Streptomyces sp. NPDC002133 TaxID=3154409 RepID=UPI00331CA07A